MTDKKDKGKSKKDLETDVETLLASNIEMRQRLVQLSEGYQGLLHANANQGILVDKYEETINFLTARLIETKNLHKAAQEAAQQE